jgi:hypothetical protein
MKNSKRSKRFAKPVKPAGQTVLSRILCNKLAMLTQKIHAADALPGEKPPAHHHGERVLCGGEASS